MGGLGLPAVTYLWTGDSHDFGANGATGGARARFRTPNFVGTGPLTDATGRKHAGISGQRIDQLTARFATDWAGNESRIVMVNGGANDVAQGAADTDVRDRATALIAQIRSTAGNSIPIIWLTQPTINVGAQDTVVMSGMRYVQQLLRAERAAGRPAHMFDCGRFLTAALGDLDGTGGGAGEHPIDGTVYGPDGVGTGYQKFAYYHDRNYLPSLAKTPLQISLTCEGWYRADDFNTSGGVVDQWNDKSGNVRHEAGTGTQRPTAVTGAMAQAALRFNGTTNVLRTGTGFTISQPFTVGGVVGPSGNNNGSIYESAGSTPRSTIFGSGAGNGLTVNAGSSVTDTTFNPQTTGYSYIFCFNGANSFIRINGVQRRLAFAVGANGTQGFATGASFANTNFFSGDHYEKAVWSGVISEADAFAIEMAWAVRYGTWPTNPAQSLIW